MKYKNKMVICLITSLLLITNCCYVNAKTKDKTKKLKDNKITAMKNSKQATKSNDKSIIKFRRQYVPNNVNIIQLQNEIKNHNDLEKYLNKNFSMLNTPIGTWNFKITIIKNRFSDEEIINLCPYDYYIHVDWLNNVNPYDLEKTSKTSRYTQQERAITVELLRDYQVQLSHFVTTLLPNKKISGNFYSTNPELLKITSQPVLVRFLNWKNYTNPNSGFYQLSELTKVYWHPAIDTCKFN